MLEGIIAVICLIVFVGTGNIEILKICGIFSIAGQLYGLREDLKK